MIPFLGEQARDGFTPLFYASFSGNLRGVEILFAFSADASIGKSRALYHSASTYAVDSPSRAAVTRLLLLHGAKADDDDAKRESRTPFMRAVQSAQLVQLSEMAKWLETTPGVVAADLDDEKKYDNVMAAIRRGREDRITALGSTVLLHLVQREF